jgi:hypothetical protein
MGKRRMGDRGYSSFQSQGIRDDVVVNTISRADTGML